MARSVDASSGTSSDRSRDPQRTKGEILEVATHEFARAGYSGARVDDIAAKTRTTKRMIYYYFGGKEGLYIAVLEAAYGRIRHLEQELDLQHLEPVEALRTLVGVTFDYHDDNRDFVRLVSVENVHDAEHIRLSPNLQGLNRSTVGIVRDVLRRGYDEGVFHRQVRPIELHTLMSALCFYRVSNQATVRAIFGHDMSSPANRRRQRALIADLLVTWLTCPD